MFVVRIHRYNLNDEYRKADTLVEVVHIITRNLTTDASIMIYTNEGFPLTPVFYPYPQDGKVK